MHYAYKLQAISRMTRLADRPLADAVRLTEACLLNSQCVSVKCHFSTASSLLITFENAVTTLSELAVFCIEHTRDVGH